MSTRSTNIIHLISMALLCWGHALENPGSISCYQEIDKLFDESLTMIGYFSTPDVNTQSDQAVLLSPQEQSILGYYTTKEDTIISEPTTRVDLQQDVSSDTLPPGDDASSEPSLPSTEALPDISESPLNHHEPAIDQNPLITETLSMPSIEKNDSVANYLEHTTREVVLKAPGSQTSLIAFNTYLKGQMPDEQRIESAEIIAQLLSLSMDLFYISLNASLNLYGNNLYYARKLIKKILAKEHNHIKIVAKRLRTLGFYTPSSNPPETRHTAPDKPELIISRVKTALELIIVWAQNGLKRISSDADPVTHNILIRLLNYYQDTLSRIMIATE